MNTGGTRTQHTRLTAWHTASLAAMILLIFTTLVVAAIRYTHSQDADSGDFRGVARTMPPGEAAGERPYEMVRAGRKPPHAPLVDFDALKGWQITGKNGGRGELIESQRQRIWESPVARLVYRGSSKESEVTILPPGPGQLGLSIVAVDGVKQLELSCGKTTFQSADIRARISRLAEASSLAVKGFDIDGRLTGEKQLLPGKKSPDTKWSIPIFPGTVRYELSVPP